MQLTTNQPEINLSQRRGKIARLPRAVREQLNVRLDDGQEADEILPWLNDLPEVRQIITERFSGVPISPQNLSAWRQGGFQEWLLHREFLGSASHMREHFEELQEAFDSNSPDDIPHTLADYMITQLSVRFTAFMARWPGGPLDSQVETLLKIGQFVLKLQQAAHKAQRQAIELPGLRRQAERDERAGLWAEAYRDHMAERAAERRAEKAHQEEKSKKTGRKKGGLQSTTAVGQSRSIKVDQGSPDDQGPRSESTETTIGENVEFGQDSQLPSSSSHTSPSSMTSTDDENRPLVSSQER